MRIPVLTARRPSPGRRTARTAREPDQGSGQGVALVCRRPGRIPVPDVALAQHLLPGIAGTVRTRSGPFMSAADSLKVTVYGRGGHGASPQNTVDPVVLAAMIIVRLQTVVSRDVAPGDIAVVTVGSCQAGTRSNVIPDFAVLELSARSPMPRASPTPTGAWGTPTGTPIWPPRRTSTWTT
jgi:hippurate hydrolase